MFLCATHTHRLFLVQTIVWLRIVGGELLVVLHVLSHSHRALPADVHAAEHAACLVAVEGGFALVYWTITASITRRLSWTFRATHKWTTQDGISF